VWRNVLGWEAKVIVTDRHLYINPKNLDAVRSFNKGFGPPVLPKAMDYGINKIGFAEPLRIPAHMIQKVEPLAKRKWQAPGVKLTLADGQTIDFRVARGFPTPAWSNKNTVACDKALRLLRETYRL
jgi:hypothetical protein